MYGARNWDPGFSVGNSILDGQHRKLLALCNQAAACMGSEDPEVNERFHLILNDLLVYADEHFNTEEAILGRYGYPELEQQKAEHLDYLEKLTELLITASDGNIDKAGLWKFLSDWWIRHILESDMQYKVFLQGNT